MPSLSPHMEPAEKLHRVAAVDIGTVTMRLAVADVRGGDIRYVARDSELVHLGEGVARSDMMGEAALARADAAARRFREVIARCALESPVERTVVLATAVARRARNAADLQRILADSGFSLQIISGEREAELSFAGATSSFAGEGILVSDVGGGSTELVFGDAPTGGPVRVRASESFGVGASVVTERFLSSDPPVPREITRARAWVAGVLSAFELPGGTPPALLISTAGTATTLVAVRDALVPYRDEAVHGQVLSQEQIDELTSRLANLTLAKRSQVPGLQPGRAGVIVGGAIVQGEVLRFSGLASCTVSSAGELAGSLIAAAAGLNGQAGT